jgi:hypothetical protein
MLLFAGIDGNIIEVSVVLKQFPTNEEKILKI